MSTMFGNFGEFIKQTVQRDPKKREARQSKRLSDGEPNAKIKRAALENITNKSGLVRIDRSSTINAKNGALQENTAPAKQQTKKSDVELPPLVPVRQESQRAMVVDSKPVQKSTAFEDAQSQLLPLQLITSEMLGREDSNLISPMEVDSACSSQSDVLALLPFDIDAEVEDDPQYCTPYVTEIFEYLGLSERKYQPADYMPMQTELTPNMRAILVDWLVDVADEYKLCSETLFLAVNYLDRFLSAKPVLRGKLQLMGIVSMLLASKYEEVYAPAIDDFVYISDNTYTKEEIFEVEATVLTVLSFNLTVPTVRMFLRRLLRAARADDTISMLASYLCELSLLDYQFVKYLPSRIAAAAVSLALHTFGFACWTPAMEHYAGFGVDTEQRNCLRDLHTAHSRASSSSLRALYEKYGTPKNLRVSLINATATPPCV